MKTTQLSAFAMAVALALAGCVDDDEGKSAKPKVSTAVPGAVVMRVDHTEALPNAFGKADVFGRTRNTGKTIVSLVSAGGGRATFRRQDVDIISAKTTMNTAPTVITTGKKATDVIVLPARTPDDQIGGVRETTFTLMPDSRNNSIVIDGHTLTVLMVQEGQLTYSAN